MRVFRPCMITAAMITAAAVITAACGAASGPSDNAVVRDSLGVAILENHAPALPGSITVGSEPRRTIGVVSGPDELMFQGIQAVLRLSDGRVVVADRGSQEIRYFAEDGSHLRTFGGAGDGPEEFRSLRHLFPMDGDALAALDGLARRLTFLDRTGDFIRSEQTDVVGSVQGRLSDGSLIQTRFANPEDGAFSDGYIRPAMAVVRAWSHPADEETVAEVYGGGVYRIRDGSGIYSLWAPFAQDLVVVVRHDRIHTITDDGAQVAVHHPEEGLERLVRMGGEPPRITPREVEAYRSGLLDMYGGMGSIDLVERTLVEAPYPEFMPVFSHLVVDGSGSFWVRLYRLPGEAGDAVWRVFDSRGEWADDVVLPGNLRVMDIGEDYIVGVFEDDLGVEFVHVYDLERPEG